jgi:hypothetical protein
LLESVSSNKSIVSMNIIFTMYVLLDGIAIYMCIQYIVAYLLKARTVEPEKQPLLTNGSETKFVSRQRLGKHVLVARQKIINNITVGLKQWKSCAFHVVRAERL